MKSNEKIYWYLSTTIQHELARENELIERQCVNDCNAWIHIEIFIIDRSIVVDYYSTIIESILERPPSLNRLLIVFSLHLLISFARTDRTHTRPYAHDCTLWTCLFSSLIRLVQQLNYIRCEYLTVHRLKIIGSIIRSFVRSFVRSSVLFCTWICRKTQSVVRLTHVMIDKHVHNESSIVVERKNKDKTKGVVILMTCFFCKKNLFRVDW
jgi:hypothetical protein